MKFGICLPIRLDADARTNVEIAKTAEALGFESRGRMTDEYIRAIRALWESERPEFHGEFVRFSNIGFNPKPFQKPRASTSISELWNQPQIK